VVVVDLNSLVCEGVVVGVVRAGVRVKMCVVYFFLFGSLGIGLRGGCVTFFFLTTTSVFFNFLFFFVFPPFFVVFSFFFCFFFFVFFFF